MSILQKIFIFGLLFSLLNCTCESYHDFDIEEIYHDDAASKKSCPKRSFNENEMEFYPYKCCYEKLKCKEKDEDTGEITTIDFKGCSIVTKEVYDHLKQNINVLKSYCSEVDIDCSGTSLSFIYFVFILLFLL